MLAGSPENLCKKIRLRMVRECGVWGQSARCKAAGQGVVAEMCGAFAARRYLPSRLHSLQASSAQVGNSVQEGRHAMKCSIVTTQVPLTTTSLTLVECLSRAPRYSPSQSTGHTLRRAQCSASTGLSAALGDRLRRIETSIEDLSSYDSSPTSTLRNSAGVSQVRTQNRFLPRAKSVTNVTNTRIFFDSRHSALSRLSSMRWPWCSNHACCASGSGTDQHNCPRVSRTGCTESATLHRRATRLCQPEYLAVADPSARLCQPECLAVADPSAQLCQPKCLAGLARNRIIVYVIRFVIRYYPISQTQSGADPSRRDPPGL